MFSVIEGVTCVTFMCHMYKSVFLLRYQTHGVLNIQNTSTVEIFSGEKKETAFLYFSGNDSERPSSKHWRK